jgi:serine/threonine protein kinase
MPIAVPIVTALGESPEVSDVVLAVSVIADTLARLHEENIAHRDIKPSNLYKYNDEWLIGDLGLIDIPGGEPLTIGAKALGPRNFIAPEMILSPDRADCRPADVYSLVRQPPFEV